MTILPIHLRDARRFALRSGLRLLAAGAVSAGLVVNLTGCFEKKPTFRGVDVSQMDYARELPLTDHNGQARRLQDFRGKVVVVFFGYTQCPDVCPTSLQELAQVKQALGAQGQHLQGIFVTVDPERDTPELLKAYMENFDASFLALRGTPEQLTAVAKDFKIYYKKAEGSTPTSYTMDHSAGSYVYDTQGKLRVYHRYGSGVQALTEDVRALLPS